MASLGETKVVLTADLRTLLSELLELRLSTTAAAAAGVDAAPTMTRPPADLLEQLATVLALPSDGTGKSAEGIKSTNERGGVSYDLVKRLGWWTQSPEGRLALTEAELDPSAYHPHSLLSSTTTLLPPSITRPPPPASLNPDTLQPSPYLPPSAQPAARPERSVGQDWAAVGKQLGMVGNVLFSAAGVAGGVYWLGGHGHKWTQTKSVLLSAFAFLAVLLVELALYAIHYARFERARAVDERAQAAWLKGGLTSGVERIELPLLDGQAEVALAGEDGEKEGGLEAEGGKDALMPSEAGTSARAPVRISLRRRALGELLGSHEDGR